MTFEQSATLKTQPQTSGTISAADAVMQSARDELIPGKLNCAIMAVVIVIVFVAMLRRVVDVLRRTAMGRR